MVATRQVGSRGDGATGQRHGTRGGWIQRAWAWLSGVCALLWRWLGEQRLGVVRTELLRAIAAAAEGTPRVDTADGAVDVVAAAAAARMRATRAPATDRSARCARRQLAQFVELNGSLAAGAERLSDAVWDVVVEAFLVARVAAWVAASAQLGTGSPVDGRCWGEPGHSRP
jgi:hypothetical protein